MRIQILALIGVTFPALKAAVIYKAESKTIEAWTPDNTIRLDFDENGEEDWLIESFYDGNLTPIVRVESQVTSAFLYQN